MNKFLASSLAVLNGMLAVIIILVSSLLGFGYGSWSGLLFGVQGDLGPLGGVLGGIIGVFVAVIVCGTLALFIDMRNELAQIRKALSPKRSFNISS